MIHTLESTIAAVARRHLRCEAPVEPDTPLDLLGLDSLATIELAAALEAELGCELPADVLAGGTSIRSLATRLALQGLSARTQEDPFEQMLADAVLPPDVRPRTSRSGGPADLRAARRILLTGATGFLGGALLRELLETTSAVLYCLSRPSSSAQLAQHPRVRVFEGDLSHPRLGLRQSTYDGLVRDIDAVCHCGAAVNWVFSYANLRSANVAGTLELLRLACEANAAFHFVSSLSACYSTEGPRTADETLDGLPLIRGVQLGYAQTKIVAEALVREAGRRGLPVRIYRPSLITGHSQTGAFNRDDLISALVRGCVAMGTAPDLDWKLDCEPVDAVAAQIVRMSREPGPVFHLLHHQPRHWRECVLWMRLYGYDVTLVSYHAWLRQLDRDTRPDTAPGRSHPLRPLRSFFLDRPAGASGLTLPEIYEESRRTQAAGERTCAALKAGGTPPPALDATLLDRYFRAFSAQGYLPDPPRGRTGDEKSGESFSLDTALFSRIFDRPVTGVEILSSGSDHSIVSELTAWRSRRKTGLFRARVTFDHTTSARDVMVKVKAHDSDVEAVGEALAALVNPGVGREYSRWSSRIGFAASHVREIEIYRQQDARFTRHAPALLASASDDAEGRWIAVLELVQDGLLMDSAEDPRRWSGDHVERALEGLAALQAIWLERERELRAQPWIGYVQSTAGMTEMSGLWGALADHAAPFFASWADPDLVSIHRRLVTHIDRWWQALECGPRTLIHNDFNPRNICLRGPDARLCAYDWELATLGAPQHDLAELLCFLLPADATKAEVIAWVDCHRAALERECRATIDPERWCEGFRSALYDLLVNRLATYTIVNRVRRQRFLPRVVRTWRNLYQLFPLEGSA